MNQTITIIGDESILTRQSLEIATLLDYQNIQCTTAAEVTTKYLFVAGDDAEERAKLVNHFDQERLVNLIHPSAFVSPTAKLAHNIIVGAQAVIGSNAAVAVGVVQNALSSIEHDNQIGAFTFLGTGAILCGNVTTGRFVFVGGGATIKPGVTIGSNTTIGTGSVLVKDAFENSTYVGNPAKVLSR